MSDDEEPRPVPPSPEVTDEPTHPFVNIQHKFFRVFGLTKMKLLLAFTVVGYNLDAIRSFVAKTAAKAIADAKKPRRKRRTETWSEIIGGSGAPGSPSSGTGRSPPPT